ncbi:MAG TPA: selenocysteine-specific translation elongation factor [Candidatus Acidoferrales bacterium]|nr:selenocysteine-specific translation elongation factor [Candidatus Acidoferrales bacterium]
MAKHVIVGTAGHIDHGKSALVEALTGTDPDRLEEEKRRGITIDLGFAFLDLGDVRLGFVDVPGHERFVRNMLAGAGGIDLMLLVVAADESIKPQTREHFDICRLLGIRRGIVAITKTDLVEPDVLGLVKLEIEEFVRGSFLEGAPVLGVSAKTGTGLEELKRELAEAAAGVSGRDASRYVRLPIDRAFAMKGFGTVVTGTLISGTLRNEDEVELFPTGKRLRVRGLHSGGRAVTKAEAGQRTAVNLADIDAGEITRGMALAVPGVFHATKRIDARITLLPSARAMKNRTRVHFHQGTAETVASVSLLGQDALRAGGTAFAQLQLDDAVFVLPGDRFILRQFSPLMTIGGGVVLDALAARHRKSDSRALRVLGAWDSGKRDEILAALALEDARGLDLARIVARTGWLESEARETIQSLAETRRIRVAGEQPVVVASMEEFERMQRDVEQQIDEFHKQVPLAPGIAKEDLRGRVADRVRPEVFRAALDDLIARRRIMVTGDIVQRVGREIALSAEESRAKEQIAQEFERAGLAAPALNEVLGKLPVDMQRAQKLLQILLREKTLVKVTEELVFHKAAVERLRELLAGYKRKHGERLPIAAFKELAGVSRKYAIPLLEYLDRQGLTRRAGDERVIL